MKPFDLEKAKEGAKVCTVKGEAVRIICFDAVNYQYPIVALIFTDEGEKPYSYTQDGIYWEKALTKDKNLCMVGEKREGWINIYKCTNGENFIGSSIIYKTKEEALKYKASDKLFIDTAKIEWEEQIINYNDKRNEKSNSQNTYSSKLEKSKR